MADRVRLRHPETGGVWDCPADAVAGWEELGWERESANLTGMSKTELEQYAAERGVDTSGANTKAQLVAAIEDSEGA
jgi:hypothetical protein